MDISTPKTKQKNESAATLKKAVKGEKARKAGPLLSWKVRQFENKPRSKKWYIWFFVVIAGLLAYGLFSDNFLLGILAILTALMFYLFEKREPQEFGFSITNEGILAQDRLYEFSSLESFWIFYEPQGRKELSLKSTKKVMPYIQVPIGDADPTKIRELLVDFLPEIEQEESVVDSLNQII